MSCKTQHLASKLYCSASCSVFGGNHTRMWFQRPPPALLFIEDIFHTLSARYWHSQFFTLYTINASPRSSCRLTISIFPSKLPSVYPESVHSIFTNSSISPCKASGLSLPSGMIIPFWRGAPGFFPPSFEIHVNSQYQSFR